MIERAKSTCKELGFKEEETEKFNDCKLKVYTQLAASEATAKAAKSTKIKKISKAEAREDKKIAKAQNVCRKIGFTPGTDKFIDCTLKMLTTTGGSQTVVVGQRNRGFIYPLHCRQMGGASNC